MNNLNHQGHDLIYTGTEWTQGFEFDYWQCKVCKLIFCRLVADGGRMALSARNPRHCFSRPNSSHLELTCNEVVIKGIIE